MSILTVGSLVANSFLATNLANLVLANIYSPKPFLPTVVPSALLASGLKPLPTRPIILSVTSCKIKSDSSLLTALDFT